MRSVLALLASTALLVLGSAGSASAAWIEGTISGKITFDGTSTNKLPTLVFAPGKPAENVVTASESTSSHLTLLVPKTPAVVDPARGLIGSFAASTKVDADYRHDSTMSDWDGIGDGGNTCTRLSSYFEHGPVTGRVSVQADADSAGRLSFSFGESPGSTTAPAVSEASSSTDGCHGQSAPLTKAVAGAVALPGCADYPGARGLVTRERRKVAGKAVDVWTIKGSLASSCAGEVWESQATATLDLVFTPGADAPTETPDRSMGLVCGKAGSDWRTVTRQKTFVDNGERACVFLVGNKLAKEVLGTSIKSGGAFANRFGKTLLMRFGPQIAKDAAPEVAAKATEIAIKRAGYKHLAKTAPLYYNAFKAVTWQVRIGDAVALQAVPLSALFATSQIKSRKACVQVIARIEKKRLLVTSSLVYSPSALKKPARDRELTRAKIYYKQKRRLRTDLTKRAYAGLSCDSKGQVRTSSVSSKAFRSVDVQIAGSGN